jgi:hypothetical protein
MWHVWTYGREEKYIQGFDGKTLFGKPKRRWEDNIKMELREIGWDVVD